MSLVKCKRIGQRCKRPRYPNIDCCEDGAFCNVLPNGRGVCTYGDQLDGISKHFTKLFAIAKKSSIYRASDIFSILRTMPFFNLARGCCRAEQASCLACSLGISVEEYCKNPLMLGCEKGNIYKMINC